MAPKTDQDGPQEGGWRELPPDAEHSWGNVSDEHWTRTRKGMNQEALEYLRERSHAPGVEEGGGPRNHYCMSCNGVIPLEYDQRAPATEEVLVCPHCGVELDARVRAMFNWVEIDQPPKSDLGPLLGVAVAGTLALGLIVFLAWLILS